MKDFLKENSDYETWLDGQCQVVKSDLDYKHERMTRDAFTFLRATCFRWSNGIESICPDFTSAPVVLSVGDAHLENFGTWRDDEGRLVWGVNDFDEAAEIPYAYDLLRLATSARLAREAKDKKGTLEPFKLVDHDETAAALVEGYRAALNAPRATVLDEKENTWLRPYVICMDKKRKDFWKEFDDYKNDGSIAPGILDGFKARMPEGAKITKTALRPKQGGGSLGRSRFVAVADWRGGVIVREAKALVPAAWDWAHDRNGSHRFEDAAKGKYRAVDPWLHVAGDFIFRRLAADARKVNLTRHADIEMPDAGAGDVRKLLAAMGFDLGSVHAATENSQAAVKADLDARDDGWLAGAAKKAVEWVSSDYEEWHKHAGK
jgi:hypothetical protein